MSGSTLLLMHRRDILARYHAGFALASSRGTFERDSAAFQSDDSQVLESLAADNLRSGHYVLNPNTSLYERTTLLEQQRTNGWTYSEELDNAAWTKTRCSISADATTAPDGESTADKVVENSDNNSHWISQSLPSTTDDTDQSLSFHGKPAGRDWVRITTVSKAGNAANSWINLSTGATGTVSGAHTIQVREGSDGWYRVELTYDVGSGGSTPTVSLNLATEDGETSYQGDGSSGLYLWGLQFEADKSVASSYIQTEGSTASRAADNLSFDFTAKPQAMTVYVRFFEMGTVTFSGVNVRLFHVGDGDNSVDRFAVDVSNTKYRLFHDPGGSVVSALSTAPSVGDAVELRCVLFSDGAVQLHQSINGAGETSATKSGAASLASDWSDTKIWLNSVGSTAFGLNAFTHVLVARGERERAYCRARAGVN